MLEKGPPGPAELDLLKNDRIGDLVWMPDGEPPAPEGLPGETYDRVYRHYPIARSRAVHAWLCYRGDGKHC